MTRGPPLLCQQGLRGRGRRRSTRPRRARRERWGRVRARCTMCGTRRRRGRGAGVGAPEGGSALLRTGSCELSGWLRAEDLLKIATLVGGAEVGGRQRGWAGPGGKRGRTCGGSAGPGAGDPQAREAQARVGDEGCGDTWARRRGPGGGTRGGRTQKAPLGGAEKGSGLDQRFFREQGPGHLRLGISEAIYAHARRKVMARRLAHRLFLPDPSAARGRERGRCMEGARPPPPRPPWLGEPAAQVRAPPHPLGHSSETSLGEKGAL